MNRDNHDKQMLRAIQRIARSIESLVQIETIVHEDLLNTVGEEYIQVRTDAEEDAENRMNRILDDEKRLSYEHGIDELVDSLTCQACFTNMQKDAIRIYAEKLKEENNV